jgi:hypothetical protein
VHSSRDTLTTTSRSTGHVLSRPGLNRGIKPPLPAMSAYTTSRGRGHDFSRLRISDSGAESGTSSGLWYFNGAPGNDSHPTETTLRTPTGGRGTFTWDVVEGGAQVELLADGSTSSARTGRTNSVRMRSRQGSKGDDGVVIRATERASDGSPTASVDHQLGVRAPAGTRSLGQETTSRSWGYRAPGSFPVPGNQSSDDLESLPPGESATRGTEEPNAAPKSMSHLSTTHSASASWGYETRVKYQVLDDTGAVMSGYDVNERWSTGVVNDVSPCDWRRGPAGGAHVAGTDFDDVIQGESAGHKPTPQAPSGGSTRVQHWGQEWYVGSVTPGSGTLVQTNTLQKYQDHATHEGVTSPPGAGSRFLSGARQLFGL